MTANTVNGSGNRARSGAQTLLLLAAPLNVRITRALAKGPMGQTALRGEVDSPAQTTLRAQLKRLAAIGTIEKHRRNRFPGVLEYQLTASGRDLLFVIDVLENWLGNDPEGPLPLGGDAARAAIKAMAEGWSTTMLRALAAAPLSLTELDGVISSLSYPSLERRLAAMRLAAQVEACPANGRGTPYAVTDWLRLGVAPLIAAMRWERRHRSEATAPISRLDVEAAFLLAVPLLRLPAKISGTCRLAMQIATKDRTRTAGVVVEVESGRVLSCATQLPVPANSWALGSPAAWLDAVIERDNERLELGGSDNLARTTLDCLHRTLFGQAPITASP